MLRGLLGLALFGFLMAMQLDTLKRRDLRRTRAKLRKAGQLSDSDSDDDCTDSEDELEKLYSVIRLAAQILYSIKLHRYAKYGAHDGDRNFSADEVKEIVQDFEAETKSRL